MKKFWIYSLACLLPTLTASAAGNYVLPGDRVHSIPPVGSSAIVIPAPPTLKYDSLSANSDRTVTIQNPRVFYRGAWQRISTKSAYNTGPLGNGTMSSLNDICQLLGHYTSDFGLEAIPVKANVPLAEIGIEHGRLVKIEMGIERLPEVNGHDYIKSVTCKRVHSEHSEVEPDEPDSIDAT